MDAETLWIITFWAAIAGRWVLHIVLAGKSAVVGPREVITALLLAIYLVLGTAVFAFGSAGPAAVILVIVSLVVRTSALVTLRKHFDYSVHYQDHDRPLARGIYRFHRNPLLLGYWCELAGFSLCLPWGPISDGLLVLICGLLCAWHAHEDNNQLTAMNSAYPRYRDRTSNLLLNLIFPERARIVDSNRLRIETFGAYACCGLLVGQVLAMFYGAPVGLFVVAIPAAFVGALIYWKLTTKQKKIRIGFSFFGGLIGASVAGAGFLTWHDQFTPAVLSAIAFGVAVGHPFGRIGCIAHGCCTGSPTDSYHPYFVAYLDPTQRINRVQGTSQIYCAPTVVLEGIGQFAIALACSRWIHLSLPIWLIGYGSLRIVIQAYRAESGDLTRVGACAVLIVIGFVSMKFTPTDGQMVWAVPSPSSVVIVITVAVLTGAAFGVRLNSTSAIPKATNDVGALSA